MKMISLQSVKNAFRAVVAGRSSFTTLQNQLDEVIIEDRLPADIPPEVLSVLHELQTVLELIAEHQASSMGSSAYYSDEQIRSKLSRFVEYFESVREVKEDGGN